MISAGVSTARWLQRERLYRRIQLTRVVLAMVCATILNIGVIINIIA
jgi:hypothetical protein